MSSSTGRAAPAPTPMTTATEAESRALLHGEQEQGRSLRARLLRFAERYALLLLGVAVAIFFSFYGPTAATFPTSGNLQAILGNQSVVAIVAIGALIPLVCEEFDLSVGAIAGLSAVFCAAAFSSGWPVALVILLGVALGLLVGVVNALIIVKLGVNAVVTTLGTSTIVAGVVIQKTGGLAVVSNIPQSVINFGSGNTLGIPTTAIVMAVVALAVYYALGHTPLGRYIYAFGANQEAARLVGLRTKLLLGLTFVASGLLCGAAGVLQVARAGGADPRVGDNFTLPALAAAFLSAASVRPGRYNVGGTLIAIFFLAVLNSGLNLAGVPVYVNNYINGAALIVGIALAVQLARRSKDV